MNFLFLGIFSDFSEFISIFNNKNKLKRAKSGLIPRGSHVDATDVALRATWQHHAGPRGAYATYTYIYNLYSLYNGYSAFRISEGYSTLRFVAPYKPNNLP